MDNLKFRSQAEVMDYCVNSSKMIETTGLPADAKADMYRKLLVKIENCEPPFKLAVRYVKEKIDRNNE